MLSALDACLAVLEVAGTTNPCLIQVSNTSQPFNYKDFNLLLQQRNRPKELMKTPEKRHSSCLSSRELKNTIRHRKAERTEGEDTTARKCYCHVDSVFSKKLFAESASRDNMLITLSANCS